MATHSSTLAWKILWTEDPGGLQSLGLKTVRQNLATKPPLSKDSGLSHTHQPTWEDESRLDTQGHSTVGVPNQSWRRGSLIFFFFIHKEIVGESSWGEKPRASGFLHTYKFKGYRCGDFLGSPVVRILLLMQGEWVQYLVRELRSHMLCGQKLKKTRALQMWGLFWRSSG